MVRPQRVWAVLVATGMLLLLSIGASAQEDSFSRFQQTSAVAPGVRPIAARDSANLANRPQALNLTDVSSTTRFEAANLNADADFLATLPPLPSDRFAPQSGTITALIELEGRAAALAAEGFADPRSPGANDAIDRAAAENRRVQADFQRALTSQFGSVRVLGNLTALTNAVVVEVDASQLSAIEALPGVRRVIPDQIGTLDNADSVPFVGAIAAWMNETGYTGQGMRIGIIDSGVDYLHVNFGGPGAGYGGNDTADITDLGFAGSKVVGGFDFVGDGWASGALLGAGGSPLGSAWVFARGDDDPWDCNGHGSHVAGTAAGFGVLAGAEYAGPWDSTAPFTTMDIGPGMAPEAEIYALKIGDCSPAVSFVAAALAMDFAMDPNGDGSMADRLDVTNNSYGGAYGTALESLGDQMNAASVAGVVMVGSAGNEGDTYYVTGDPSIAERTISVASSINDRVFAALRLDSGDSSYPSYPTFIAANPSQGGSTTPVGPLPLRLVAATGGGNSQGCALADYAGFAGEVGLIYWTGASGCGSGTRMNNAVDATNVSGLVVVSDAANFPFINLACTYFGGPSSIPCVSVTEADGLNLVANPAAFTVSFDPSFTATLPFSIGDQISGFTSRGPVMDFDRNIMLKPDMTAPGDTITSTATGTGNGAETLGGTSMAAPHVAGAAAVLRQKNPTWTPAQIKAALMNTATHDLYTGSNQTGDNYGLSRIGAGRLDIQNAIDNSVIAYDALYPHRVSVSFGLVEAVTATSLTRSITVRNLGGTSQSYNLYVQQMNDTSGAQFSVSPSSITVPGGGTVTVTVTLTVDPAAMSQPFAYDPTTPATQPGAFGTLPRIWFAEEGAYVVLDSTTATPDLRVPVHAVPRPASDLAATSSELLLGPFDVGQTVINFEGVGVNTGPNLPFDINSAASAFELILLDPVSMPGFASNGDVRAIGVTSDFWPLFDLCGGNLACAFSNMTIYFAIVTEGDWGSLSGFDTWFELGFDIDEDNAYDAAAFNFETGFLAGADWTDTIMTWVADGGSWLLGTGTPLGGDFVNGVPANAIQLYPYNNNVIIMSVPNFFIGLDAANTDFQFDLLMLASFFFADWVPTAPPFWATYDVVNSRYSFGDLAGSSGGPFWGPPIWFVEDGFSIPVDYDRTGVASPADMNDLLVLYHHNAQGNRYEILNIDFSTDADWEVTKTANEVYPAPGSQITYTVELANNGPVAGYDPILRDTLPAGFTYISDDCVGVVTVTPDPAGTVVECDLTGYYLPPDTFLTWQIVAQVSATAQSAASINVATVASWNPANTDPVIGNNTDTALVCVGGLSECDPSIVIPGQPGAGIAAGGMLEMELPPFFTPGTPFEAKLKLTNTSGAALNDTTVSVNFSAGVNIVSTSSSQGSAAVSGQTVSAARFGTITARRQNAGGPTVTFNLGSVAAGGVVTMSITVNTPLNFGELFVTVAGQAVGNGSVVGSVSGIVPRVSALPATGETPIWRDALLLALGAGVLTLLAGAGVALRRRASVTSG